MLVDEDLTSPVARLRGDDAAAWAQRLADLENANRELRRRVRELEDTTTRPVQVHATVEEALAAAASKHPALVVTDKARRSARESPYRWPDRVAAAVDAIGQVASRWAAGPMGRSLADAFEELGFTYAPHIGDTTAGMWGGQYEVTHDNVTYPMPGHVKLGVGSAEQCIRIHLAFDDERRQVLIGWAGLSPDQHHDELSAPGRREEEVGDAGSAAFVRRRRVEPDPTGGASLAKIRLPLAGTSQC